MYGPLAIDTTPRLWNWRGFAIAYQSAGETGPAIVLVHGFGASREHWRQNLPVLGQSCRCFALDLIGFGASAKPRPGEAIEYTFETWGAQIADFCREVVGGPAYLVGNSIGCIAILQAAVAHPEIALKIAAINCSLRLLHERKRGKLPWYRRLGAGAAQTILRYRPLGALFFRRVARPATVRRILRQAYHRQEAVTEELVEILLKPSRDEGAVDVFLAFIGYSGGPLPEDLLARLTRPALLLWGTEDPWEPIALGREFARFPAVERFIPLEGAGHCPHDEVPEIVNPILLAWVRPGCPR